MSTTGSLPVLIGDLLVRSKMTTARNMADAVPISLKTGLPIGRVLIGSGALTEEHLQQALLAQSLIRESLLSLDLAIEALRIVAREGFTLEQALKIVGWQPESFSDENRLGKLLVAAGIIDEAQLSGRVADKQWARSRRQHRTRTGSAQCPQQLHSQSARPRIDQRDGNNCST